MSNPEAIVQTVPANGSGALERKEFGATQALSLAETSALAAAAQAKAEVEARYVLALRRPRDWAEVRLRVMAACKRPYFAKAAKYRKPVGREAIVGLSIRFVEEALRAATNVYIQTTAVYDDPEKRIVRVAVTDLENNITYHSDLTILKQVERSSAGDRKVFGSRKNSYGKPVYIVEATEDDLINKQAALVSKGIRTHGLRIIPGDILDEASFQIDKTLDDEDAKDPEASRRQLVDGFAAIGVRPDDLKEYLGHVVGQASPAELQELRQVGLAIKDGETSWKETLEAKRGVQEPAASAPAGEAPVSSGGVKDRVKAKAQEVAAPAPSGPRPVAGGNGGVLIETEEPPPPEKP